MYKRQPNFSEIKFGRVESDEEFSDSNPLVLQSAESIRNFNFGNDDKPSKQTTIQPRSDAEDLLELKEAKDEVRNAAKLIAVSAVVVATSAVAGGFLARAISGSDDSKIVNTGRIVGGAVATTLTAKVVKFFKK